MMVQNSLRSADSFNQKEAVSIHKFIMINNMFLYIFSKIFIVVFNLLLNPNSISVILITRKSTHSKVDAPESDVIWSLDHASSVDQTGEAFLFLLVPLIEKGKKRYNQTPKGNQ